MPKKDKSIVHRAINEEMVLEIIQRGVGCMVIQGYYTDWH